MLPPLLRIFFDDPGLLRTHAAAYSELIRQETGTMQTRFAHRVAYTVALAGSVLLALLFAGVALMLYAVSGVAHWLLWLVPGVPLLAAAFSASMLMRMPKERAYPRTRAQFDEDMHALGWNDRS